MAEYLYKVEGIYETDKGSGKEYTNFSFDIKLSRFYPEGAGTHILRRFLPILIRKQKNKPLLSSIKSWLIVDIEKVSDEFPLVGRAIEDMDEMEIQELACMYDIFEIPLPNTMSIIELRYKAMEAYMKKVLKAKIDTPEEKERNAFYRKQIDGSYKLDFGEEKLKVCLVGDYEGKKQTDKKITLKELEEKAKRINEGAIFNDGADVKGGYPSLSELEDS